MITRLEALYSGRGRCHPHPISARTDEPAGGDRDRLVSEHRQRRRIARGGSRRAAPQPRRRGHDAARRTVHDDRDADARAAGGGDRRGAATRPRAPSRSTRPDAAKLDAMVTSYLDAVTTLDVHDHAFTAEGPRHREARRRRHPCLGQRLEPAAREAAGGDGPGRHQRGVGESPSRCCRLRRTVEDLDPSQAGRPALAAQAAGHLALRRQARDYFGKYQSSQTHLERDHQRALPRPGRAAPGQRRHRAGEGQPVGDHGPAAPVRLPRPAARRGAVGADRDASRRPIPTAPRSSRTTCSSRSARRSQDLLTQLAVSVQGYLALDLIRRNNVELIKGVDRAHDDHRVGAAHGGHRRPGAGRPEAGARPDHGAQHDDRRPDRVDRRDAAPAVGRHQRAGGLGHRRRRRSCSRRSTNIYATMDEIDTLQGQGARQHARRPSTRCRPRSTSRRRTSTAFGARTASTAARASGGDGNSGSAAPAAAEPRASDQPTVP